MKKQLYVYRKHSKTKVVPVGKDGLPCPGEHNQRDQFFLEQADALAEFFKGSLPYKTAEKFAERLGIESDDFWRKL